MGTKNPSKISPRQRRWLKAKAHSLKPTIWVSEDGISAGLGAAVLEALGTHELIKVRLRRPDDKSEIAESIAVSASAHLVGVVGHTVILYRAREEKPSIVLPS